MATQRQSIPAFDRVPPHSEEAERAVLGAMLLEPDAVGTVFETLQGAGGEVFYYPAHQHIYEAAVNLFKEGQPLDAVVLKERLARTGHLDEVGGLLYISELSGVVPTAANVEHYARIVLDLSLLRSLIKTCTRTISEAYDSPDDVSDLLDRAEGNLFKIADQRQANPIYNIATLLPDGIARIEKQMKSNTAITGVATGFHKLDELTSGFQVSDMIILAARPSVGKTAFALNVARHAAVEKGLGVLLFSLEMSKEQLLTRLLCMQGKVNSQRLRTGFLSGNEFPKLTHAASALSDKPIFIDDTPNISLLELRSKARRHKSKHDCDIIVIDYLQLMRAGGRAESRQVEIAEISRSVKALARELSVPIVALSQLSREADKDDTGQPRLSHLRESGAIEQDADVVMLLSRPPLSEQEAQPDLIHLNLAKQRNGPTGKVELLFDRNIQRFKNLAEGVLGDEEPPPEAMKYDPNIEQSYDEEDDVPF